MRLLVVLTLVALCGCGSRVAADVAVDGGAESGSPVGDADAVVSRCPLPAEGPGPRTPCGSEGLSCHYDCCVHLGSLRQYEFTLRCEEGAWRMLDQRMCPPCKGR